MTENTTRTGGELTDEEVAAALEAEQADFDVDEFAEQIAGHVESFLIAVRDIAAQPDKPEIDEGLVSLPYLLLELSQLLLAGGRLGAMADFVPPDRFEADAGPDADLESIRSALAVLFEGLDEYAEVFDPYGNPPEINVFRISDDLTSIAEDLFHGWQHYEEHRVLEALWWWQFSYVSSWGVLASGAMRAILALIAHDRLDPSLPPKVEAEDRDLVEAARQAVQNRRRPLNRRRR